MNSESFAARLRKARSERKLTQGALATASGIAAAQLSRYELGDNTPRSDTIAKLAEALDVTFDWLAYGSQEPIPPISLVVSEELDQKLSTAAHASGRSIAAEIVARLEQSFSEPLSTDTSTHSDIADLVKQQKLYHIETLEMQLTSIENELSRLHFPLADAHRNLDAARAGGNAAEIKKYTEEADRMKRAMSKLDERYESCLARLAALRKELKQVTSSHLKK